MHLLIVSIGSLSWSLLGYVGLSLLRFILIDFDHFYLKVKWV